VLRASLAAIIVLSAANLFVVFAVHVLELG
jgi:hypothetical protein